MAWSVTGMVLQLVQRGHLSAECLLFTVFILRNGGTSMPCTTCGFHRVIHHAKTVLFGWVLVSVLWFFALKLFSNLLSISAIGTVNGVS